MLAASVSDLAIATIVNDHECIIISVKPKWAKLILNGSKSIELRRAFTEKCSANTLAFIYVSAPVSAILGYVTLHNVSKSKTDKAWQLYGGYSAVNKKEFFNYFKGKELATALHLRNPVETKKIPLSELRELCNFTPPVSWRFTKAGEKETITSRM